MIKEKVFIITFKIFKNTTLQISSFNSNFLNILLHVSLLSESKFLLSSDQIKIKPFG